MEYLPLREVVFLTLRKKILKGELAPGERLMEVQLAEKLGVSRTPIREAMRMLEKEGLVVMRPRRGAQVAQISLRDLNDVLEVRKTLEMLAIRKACARMKSSDIAAMKQAAGRFEKLVASDGELTEMAEADESFHQSIYEGARNARLTQILENLREQMYRFRFEYLKDEKIRRSLVEEHRAIAAAVEGKNEEEAIRLIARHINNQWKAIYISLQDE